jgi:hypothetical protein
VLTAGTCNLHHDNAPAHTALLVLEFRAMDSIPVLPQLTYSLVLSPRQFSLLPKIKITLKRMQPFDHAGSSLADFSTLKMEAISSSETSVHTRTTRRHIPENGILHSHRRENLKSYKIFLTQRTQHLLQINILYKSWSYHIYFKH